MSDKRECCPKCGSPWCDSPQIIGGGGGEPQAANNPRNASIPYTSAYFGCCNRTVQTRADIAQPKYCPFCGKALAEQPKGTLEQVIGREDVISVCGKHSVQFCDQEDCYICAKREPAPRQPAVDENDAVMRAHEAGVISGTLIIQPPAPEQCVCKPEWEGYCPVHGWRTDIWKG